MANINLTKLFRIILSSLSFLTLIYSCSKDETNDLPPVKSNSSFIIAGYLPEWGITRINNQELSKLDIIYYFSIQPDSNGNFEMNATDQNNINNLKAKLNSKTKLFVTIGGWYESETIFPMASDAVKRHDYALKLLKFCQENQIRGIDLDWEDYPKLINEDQYIALTKELSDVLKPAGIKLSIAAGTGPAAISRTVKCVPLVDYINLMSYGELDSHGNHATYEQLLSDLKSYENKGISKSKIIAGVPFYAQRPYISGDASPFTITYRKIAEQAQPLSSQTNYGNYSFNSRDLLKQKTHYLKTNNYAGIMAWELSQDTDFLSEYSLLSAILQETGKE
ncbi:MAG: glycoside hydrolase family 18 protein [Bacteroidota bacterium]|nr:glycoside hydrolase family 18 protein [Bacteroidota bacterium]